MGRVVFCMPKAYGAIGAARAGRFSYSTIGSATPIQGVG